mmetsp:Transcript_14211/g.40860  ORF Transcript_14211/g.40860 Transcript_14211/m.40860 type:complete len:208 (+) Transcript_14211:584-1207(+)
MASRAAVCTAAIDSLLSSSYAIHLARRRSKSSPPDLLPAPAPDAECCSMWAMLVSLGKIICRNCRIVSRSCRLRLTYSRSSLKSSCSCSRSRLSWLPPPPLSSLPEGACTSGFALNTPVCPSCTVMAATKGVTASSSSRFSLTTLTYPSSALSSLLVWLLRPFSFRLSRVMSVSRSMVSSDRGPLAADDEEADVDDVLAEAACMARR